MNVTHLAVLSAFSAALVTAHPAVAEYPELPVRIIVPFNTGGGTDIQARLLADGKGAPREAIETMKGEIRKALASEQIKQFMAREALDAVGSSPQELAAQIRREMAKYGDVIRIGQIHLQ